jgi:rhamnose utilization protein RhaD (predicted bifunctional aldolase and dehydrogenase)
LVVCGDTPEEVQAITLDVIQKTSTVAREYQFDPSRISKAQGVMERIGYKLPSDPLIHSLACSPSSLESFSRENNVLYPDQAVFLGKNAVIIRDVEKNIPPANAPFIVIPNVGVFINQSASVMVEAMLLCHAEVLARVPADAHLNYLSDSEVAELTNWDAEKYRKSIN